MIFNSLSFCIFFFLFFIFYWFITKKNLKAQNLLLLSAGYFFYAWADWKFLSYLIALSTLNFYIGIYIEKNENEKIKRLLLNVALFQAIGGLAFFKYFNFFITSFNDFFLLLGIRMSLSTLNILVPLGISFFTFRTINYVLDIHKGKMKPTTDWIVFFNYVSFFPTILSGPIDSARTFIPQLQNKRNFDYEMATDGMRQILWGLYKKVVVADNCAVHVNSIFKNYQNLTPSSLLVGAFLYTIQMYCDFSGYSDMAIGISKLLGIRVAKNFDFPFFAQNIADFWRKWHMSLTTWLTEYVFTPISIYFRNYGKFGLALAIILNFTICGIWHGANWTYVLFGFLHGCYFIPLIISGTMNKRKKIINDKVYPSFQEFFNIIKTFSLVMLTLIIFRSNSIKDAYLYFKGILGLNKITDYTLIFPKKEMTFIFLTLSIEWIGQKNNYALEKLSKDWYKPIRWGFYFLIVLLIFLNQGKQQTFIYFQF